MAGAVEVFKTNMIETERLRAEQSDVEQRQLQLRKADMHKLADAFEGAVMRAKIERSRAPFDSFEQCVLPCLLA